MLFYALYLIAIMALCGRYKIEPCFRHIEKTRYKYGYSVAIMLIVFMSSIRYGIGYDWNTYVEIIDWYARSEQIIKFWEFFNNYIIYIGAVLKNYNIVFGIYALLTYTAIGYLIIKYSKSKYESLIIYFCLFYLPSLSTIRAALAVAVVFWGYKYIKEKKPLKYILVCIVASGFHKFAFVGLLIYPLYYCNIFVVLLGIPFFDIIAKKILPVILEQYFPKFYPYVTDFSKGSGNMIKFANLGILVYCIILLLSRWYLDSYIDNDLNEAKNILKICMIGVAMPFILGGRTGTRVADFILIYFVLLVPICNKNLKIGTRLISMIPFYIYYFIYLKTTLVNGDSYIPFVTCFGKY